jgi:hypothetical protein
MSAPIRIWSCAKSAASETGTAKAAEVTSATTKPTTVETTTTESSASTTAAAGPCRLTKTNKSDDY